MFYILIRYTTKKIISSRIRIRINEYILAKLWHVFIHFWTSTAMWLNHRLRLGLHWYFHPEEIMMPLTMSEYQIICGGKEAHGVYLAISDGMVSCS